MSTCACLCAWSLSLSATTRQHLLAALCFPPQAGDGCGSPLHRLRSPLHGSLQVSSPLSGPSPFSRTTEFSFDTSTVRRSLEQEEQPSSPLIRYRPLTNTSSQEALGGTPTSSSPKSCHSSDSSPIYARRERHSEGNGQLRASGDGRDMRLAINLPIGQS